jgi:hypothetical protein
VAEAVGQARALLPLGLRPIKGYEEELQVFAVDSEDRARVA